MQVKKRNVTYDTWRNMKMRCTDPKHLRYCDYGGKGVTFEPRWLEFKNFLADMGERPLGLTLERLDNNKGYSKNNCEWATTTKQALNKRNRKDNTSGIKGVSWSPRLQKWRALGTCKGRTESIYTGSDFFIACCARKSWENRIGARTS